MQGFVSAVQRHGDRAFATLDLGSDEIVMRFDDDQPALGDELEIWTRRFHLFGSSGRAIAHIG
jgi:hypothetical protein